MGQPLKDNVLLTLLTAFSISLFLPEMPVIGNLTILALFFYCFCYTPFKTRLLCLKRRPMLLLLLAFFTLELLSAFLSADQTQAWKFLSRRTTLVVFPLCIGSIYIHPRLFCRILLGYAAATTIAAVIFFTASLFRVWRTGDTQWLYDDSLTILLHRSSTYMAWMVTIALFCYFVVLRKLARTSAQRWVIYAVITFLLIFHYLLASRSSIIFLYSTILIIAAYYSYRTRRRALWAGMLLFTIALAGIVLLFPKTINRFREFQYTGYDYHNHGIESHYNMVVTQDQWNGANIRLAIWRCGLTVARKHWLTGIPLGDKQQALMAEYKRQDFTFAYEHKRNMHNTYLDVLVNTGIPGLILFVFACIALPIAVAIRFKNTFAIAVTCAIATAIFPETWLDQALGCLLLGFWVSLLSAVYSPLSSLYNLTASSVSPKKSKLPLAI